jgi:hypothetical protein
MHIVITGIIVCGRNCVESVLRFVASWDKKLHVTVEREFSPLLISKYV